MRMRKIDRKSVKENITEYREEQNLNGHNEVTNVPNKIG
jgi:hypothetical protein